MTAILVLKALASTSYETIQEKHSLLPKVSVGDRFDYEMDSVATVGGGESQYTVRFEMTIASLEPKGTITFRNAQKNGKFKIGGQEQVVPESTATTKTKLTGELLSMDPPSATPEQARFGRLTMFRVPEEPVAVGQKWSWKDAPSGLNGNVGSEGSAECVEFAEKGGAKCARLKIALKESSGDAPSSATMDIWVSTKDGMPVEMVLTLKNAPVAPGLNAEVVMKAKRVSKG